MYQWNAAAYASHSQGQERWALELLADIQLQTNEQVLDVGCGDGRITASIAAQIPLGRVVGVDLSADMIAHATTEFTGIDNLSFRQMDASKLQFDNEFTLVFSNAALHWVRDHQSVLAGISRALRPGGRLIAQMGGAGNGAGMIAAFDKIRATSEWKKYFSDFKFSFSFHHPDKYAIWFSENGLQPEQCELLLKDMVHTDTTALTGWISTTWHPYTSPVPVELREKFIAQVVENYVQAHPADPNGQVHVQMARLQIKARKA